MTLTLDDEERTLLAEILDRDLRELGHEINHTDDHGFKARLRHRESVLNGILARVRGGSSAAER